MFSIRKPIITRRQQRRVDALLRAARASYWTMGGCSSHAYAYLAVRDDRGHWYHYQIHPDGSYNAVVNT